MMAQKSTILSEHKDRDDIETHTHIGIIVIFEIASCDAFVTRALPRVYRLRRKAFLSVLTSFHLDEAERIVLKRDDIRLASDAFPVAIEDLVFAALKEARGSLFSPLAEFMWGIRRHVLGLFSAFTFFGAFGLFCDFGFFGAFDLFCSFGSFGTSALFTRRLIFFWFHA